MKREAWKAWILKDSDDEGAKGVCEFGLRLIMEVTYLVCCV
jgi:hypothetical protein